jgi:hypothetical protein
MLTKHGKQTAQHEGVRKAKLLAKFLPPMAFLGPDYIKAFGDK